MSERHWPRPHIVFAVDQGRGHACHAIQAESFDAVVCGWTLSYSTAPALAVSEIVRVVRNGGVVAIGVEHVPSGGLERRHGERRDANLISPEDDGDRINSVTAVVELLGQAVKTVYVHIDAPLAVLTARELEVKTGLASSQCIVVCSVNKPRW